ncbi:MAG: MipA/OmpV family protein, partial [Gammaproteobacteria bacterium]|nr:MipA/OmpV family protein [Gammaproteobacteria bacterium]
MKTDLIRSLFVTASAIFLSQSVMAGEFSVDTGKRPITIGIGALYKDKPYKNYDSSEKTSAVPLVLYEGEHFFARGSTIGWDFMDSDSLELAVIGEILNDGYDSGDSKFLKGMSDRDPSFALGGHVIWKPDNLGLKLAAVTDMADNSDGTQVRGEVFYTHRTGDWMLKPYAAIVWQNEDYNDYYYGVRAREANLLIGRTPYSADSDFNYRFGAVAVYQQKTSPWMYIGGLRYD